MPRPLPVLPRAVFHSHTFRCGHAEGTVDDLCRAALDAAIPVLGVSDHAPFPDNRFRDSRMDFSEIEDYCRDVRAAQGAYAGRLRVLLGFEVDYFPSIGPAFYEDLFFGRLRADYLLAAVHFLEGASRDLALWGKGIDFGPDQVRPYIDAQVKALETGLFSCLAHPDMFASRCPASSPAIEAVVRPLFAAAAALGVPVELNAYGLRKPPLALPDGSTRPLYPWRPFWDLAATIPGLRVLAGPDAHRPQDLWSNMPEAFAWAAQSGIVPENAPLPPSP
ncbi:MAG: histidinol-phosphatase [Kiritimatiellia bacterium]|jgi:histidinol-phosphatase (PHP family)